MGSKDAKKIIVINIAKVIAFCFFMLLGIANGLSSRYMHWTSRNIYGVGTLWILTSFLFRPILMAEVCGFFCGNVPSFIYTLIKSNLKKKP